MKKFFLLSVFAALLPQLVVAQSPKLHPPSPKPKAAPERLRINPWPGRSGVPLAPSPLLEAAPSYRPVGPLRLPKGTTEAETERVAVRDWGLPIWFCGQVKAAEVADAERPVTERALAYLAALRPEGVEAPEAEFVARRSHTDEQGNWHVRLEQVYRGIPVYGAEVIAHTEGSVFTALNGRYYPTPTLSSTTPTLSAAEAIAHARAHLGPHKTEWTEAERALVGGQECRAELVIYHVDRQHDRERLAWVVTLYADLLHRKVYFIDAHDGTILYHFDHTCRISPFHPKHAAPAQSPTDPHDLGDRGATLAGNPVVASGLDLKNIHRAFGAWQEGSTIFMIDASQPMFKPSSSQMPYDPVGAIITLSAKNTTPANSSTFDYEPVVSGSTVFNNNSAVSAHWNAIQSYNYFRTTHGRNSINGQGGNIISFINVAEEDGGPMDNAFWNGYAMWYGAGRDYFFDLARGIDVGAHEMGHGVIESTANLEYQNESGALNESFADIFGVGVDREDWLIGEDVVRPGVSPYGCLRDMQHPERGLDPQPGHMNQKYTGPLDNGGVHINSGIINRAFVLFATNAAVGLDKAERVFYKALRDYLVKSSQFIDARLAVIQAATDLYGNAVANAAATAFSTVGIGSGQGGNYLGLLNANPGEGLILSNTNNGALIELHTETGAFIKTLYNGGVASRPSVSDNGQQIVFVNSEGHVIGIDLQRVGSSYIHQVYQLSQYPEWRNVAISKDGRFLAGITQDLDNQVYIFDLASPIGDFQAFTLYNPTYTTGQVTGEVQYADVLEFDYSSQYLMYDAFNRLVNTSGQTLTYWDIGFLRFWENNGFASSTPFISKLFNNLPPQASVGNPVFSQQAPYVIAFDFIDGEQGQYHVLGTNVQTGEVNYLILDNGDLGWPSYMRTDEQVLFQRKVGNQYNLYRRQVAPNRIEGIGSSAPLVISSHDWGRWFGFGTRSLQVSAPVPASSLLGVSVSPNPVSEVLRLNVALSHSSEVGVEVVDLLGRSFLAQSRSLAAGAQQLELDLSGLPAGTYVVRLWALSETVAVRVVKH